MKKPKSHAHHQKYSKNRQTEGLALESGVKEVIMQLQQEQQVGEMQVGDSPRVSSVWKVPDLTLRGYRNPELSRQYVVTLTHGMDKKEFCRRVRGAFDS